MTAARPITEVNMPIALPRSSGRYSTWMVVSTCGAISAAAAPCALGTRRLSRPGGESAEPATSRRTRPGPPRTGAGGAAVTEPGADDQADGVGERIASHHHCSAVDDAPRSVSIVRCRATLTTGAVHPVP